MVKQKRGGPIADGVPWHGTAAVEIGFDIPERYNASEVLFQNLRNGRGDNTAVTGPAGRRSYAELCVDAARWGNALLSLGFVRGDRVLLLLDDTPAYPAAFFGAVRAGLVPLLINVLTPPDLLQFYLTDSGAKAAVAEAGFADRFSPAACAGTQLKTLIIADGNAGVSTGVETKEAKPLLACFSDQLPLADTHRTEMAFWMYSSGSTGRPKGIVHLQHDMAYTARSYGHHVLRLTSSDVCFSVPKIFFSYGFGNSITFPFSVGATSVLMPGQPKAPAILATIAQFRPTVFFGLPTLYAMLTKSAELEGADLSSIRLAVSAAEVLSPEIFNNWKRRTGLEIVECLGSTEVLNVYLSNRPERKKPGSSGTRVPGYELVLKDSHGDDVADGREGVLWVRGHSNTPLYWNRPRQTSETVHDSGWICTGDRFVRDADGFYFFRGRIDDLVKISGQWVHPIEVQLCLAEHPSVRECAVMAVELPDRRMTLKAFVVMNAASFDAKEATLMLQLYVKHKLLPYKYPRVIEFLTELPKTGTGKIDRQALVRGAGAPVPARVGQETAGQETGCCTRPS
jgi:acetyl-CoA synthetase